MPPVRVPYLAYSGDAQPGQAKEHPFRIVAMCLDRTLGDFASSLVFAANVKAQFDHAALAVYYRNDRPYKRDILEACPGIDALFEMSGRGAFAFEAFDRGGAPPLTIRSAEWYQGDWPRPNLVLAPTMSNYGSFNAIDRGVRFRFPEERAARLQERLVDLGVDPDRWFCVIHYREPTYDGRPAQSLRDVDSSLFSGVAGRMIAETGGQVVRIGHPAMAPLPARDGYVDLAPFGDEGFSLQLFAISRARFLLMTDSGPANCGSAFGTPTAACCTPSLYTGVWNRQDACMRLHILAPDGRLVTPQLAHRQKLYSRMAMETLIAQDFQIRPQSEEEIVRLGKLMLDRTADTPAWRTHWYEPAPTPRPNRLAWPPEKAMAATEVWFPDLAPGTGVLDYAGD